MVKRKAEDYPGIEPESELNAPDYIQPVDSAISGQSPTPQPPTGEEHREEPTGCHLELASADLGDGFELGDNPFWALLAADGYKIWWPYRLAVGIGLGDNRIGAEGLGPTG